MFMCVCMDHISSNKCCPQISAAPLVIHIEIITSPLISTAPINAELVKIVTIIH